MSASSARIVRAIPPSLPRGRFLRQLPTRPLYSLHSLCCGPSPFRPTPALLRDPLEFWFPPTSGTSKDKGEKTEKAAAEGEDKDDVSQEVEEAFPADDELPTIVEWDALTEPPEVRHQGRRCAIVPCVLMQGLETEEGQNEEAQEGARGNPQQYHK